MGVFKNEVGRPSNETIKKRNIRKGIIITLAAAASCYLLVFIINLIFGLLGIGMSKSVYFILSFIQFKLPIYIILIGLLASIIIICIKKTKEGKLKCKHYLIIVSLLILFMLIYRFSNKMYTYNDNHKNSPSSIYKIRINKLTKVLHANVYINCISKDCTPQIYKYSLKLTSDEYENVKKLWNDKENLSLALFYLRDKDDILYNSYNEYKEEYYGDGNDYNDVKELKYYNKMDSNSDGKVTHREFADQFMIDILNEKK